MKKKITKIIAILSFVAAICVTGFTLSQNNEYKKFLELNKRALAEEGVHADFGYASIDARCKRGLQSCTFQCPHCTTEYRSIYMGDIVSFSGNCPSCGRFFN